MFWSRRKKRPLSDLAEEIESHLALEADQLRDSGHQGDAVSAARRAFGNVTSVEEAFYERGRWLWFDSIARDLRQAFRLFARRPAFSVVVIVTLALGIGANTTIFSVMNAVLLRPLPYRDPGRLAMLWQENSAHDILNGRVSLLNFADWKNSNHTFEDMTFFGAQTFLLGNPDGPPERMRSARIDGNFFSLLGVKPVLGRVFGPDEERRAEPVVVLSYRLWQRSFGGSPQALGADILMDGRKSRVIGVMPESFQYPFEDTQVWEPVTAHRYWAARDRASLRSFSVWFTLGRLRAGTRFEDAQADMSRIASRLAAIHPENKDLPEIRVVPLTTQTTGSVERPLAVLLGAVFLMLLIACINVANLLLASGSAREREFAVRRALGAGRGRLAALLLTENLVLALAGGLLGLGLAYGALRAVIAYGPRDIPRLGEARIDAMVLAFTFALSIFTAIVSGLWPALRTGGATVARSRHWITAANRNVRDVLVIGEFAIALVLLTGAGLLVRSFALLERVDPGFRPEKLLIMRVDLHVGRTGEQQAAYFREAVDRVRALPGVSNAAAVTGFLRTDPEDSVLIEGHPSRQQPGPCADLISGPFFETAGIPLKNGRLFTDGDRKGSPLVGIINEKMARTYWPGENPIGKRFRLWTDQPWIEVVGVSGDMRRQGFEKEPAPQVFLPEAQRPDDMMDVIVRTSSDPLSIAAAVRTEIQSIDPTVAKFNVTTAGEQIAEQGEDRRFQTSLFGLFSLIALTMSAIGIYGLMHFFVVERTNEIGVRMALGARYSNVLALVLRQGLALAVAGTAAGVVAALGLTHLLASLLFGVSPTDPLTFVGTPVMLLAVAALACWVPARRAARVDPVLALRRE